MMFPKPEKPVRGGKGAREYMSKVAARPCVICAYWPVQVHHCRDGRFAQTKPSDFDTIPLCDKCHDERHLRPTAWRERNGPDTGFLPLVREMIRLADERTV
jgi:hypothetical protein